MEKMKFAPGEMEKIKLDKKMLAGREHHTLSFAIVPNEEVSK